MAGPAQLAALRVSLPMVTNNIAAAVQYVGQVARADVARQVLELTQEQMIRLEQRHAEASQRFQALEADGFDRMEALADARALDIGSFQRVRSELLERLAPDWIRDSLLC